MAALWTAALRDRELLKPEVDDVEIRAVTLSSAPNVGFHLGATALAIPAPRAAAFVYLGIALLAMVRARPDSTAEPDSTAGPGGEPPVPAD